MIGDAFYKATGFATIRDKTTGEILLDGKKNAIHLGNLSVAIVEALSGKNTGFIRYMAFGNGGSLISESGQIVYRTPNVSQIVNRSSSLYNETFKKEIIDVPGNEVFPVLSNSTYSDINVIVTLGQNEPQTQDNIDRQEQLSSITLTEQPGPGNFLTYANSGDAVFDELALYCGVPGIAGSLVNNTSDALLVTHLIFHPIQKSSNRILEIDYTVRIQLT